MDFIILKDAEDSKYDYILHLNHKCDRNKCYLLLEISKNYYHLEGYSRCLLDYIVENFKKFANIDVTYEKIEDSTHIFYY